MEYEFKVMPVQSFIEASRSIDEYHSSSLILSHISYWAMTKVLDRHGKIIGRNWKRNRD